MRTTDRLASVPRAGRLACFCPPGVAPDEDERAAPSALSRYALTLTVVGFALSVLAQTLAIGILPIAGLLIATVVVSIVTTLVPIMSSNGIAREEAAGITAPGHAHPLQIRPHPPFLPPPQPTCRAWGRR